MEEMRGAVSKAQRVTWFKGMSNGTRVYLYWMYLFFCPQMISCPAGWRKDLIVLLYRWRLVVLAVSRGALANRLSASLGQPLINPRDQDTTWSRSCGRSWNVVAIDGGPIRSRE